MKLFISYSSRDREKVSSLVEDLKKIVKVVSRDDGGDVWFDQELIGGHDWWENILSKIRACDVFLFIVTQDSLRSDPCRLEYTYAHSLSKRILPILLGDGVNVTLLPEPLQRIQFVDYRNRTLDSYQHLSGAMASLPPAIPMPNPLPQPPSAPISPLAQFQQQLESKNLSIEIQTSLVFQLKQYLADPQYAESARYLLMELRKHPDTRAQIAEEISIILKDTPPPRATSSSQQGGSLADIMNRGKELLQPKPASQPPLINKTINVQQPPSATPPQYGAPIGGNYGAAPKSDSGIMGWWKKQTQITQIVVAVVILGILSCCLCYCLYAIALSGTSTTY
ncbi:MAG: toll/interleukin-1 receptor domain-containing protein [Chloroflexi bacterium]|nr:toll/interleukin-1 receptor domain-containing protein [Chloroflexota bacterium]